jgi:hypothetical protein
MPVVFPDGTRATIVYPREVDLAGMGMQPDVTLVWDGRWIGPIVFAHGGPHEPLLGGRSPLATHDVDGRRVEEWDGREGQEIGYGWHRWLLFRLPGWTVHVPLDHLMETSEVLDAVAPRTTEQGFVVVDVADPAELSTETGDGGGTQVSFGDAHPDPVRVDPGLQGLLIELAPAKGWSCRPERSVDGDYGSACLADGRLTVQGTVFSGGREARSRLADAISGIRVRDLDLG